MEQSCASAMLPDMTRKPRVAIVGPGNLGSALAISLRGAGYRIEAIVGRSRQTARSLGERVAARAFNTSEADLVWFCVPDSEIGKAAGNFAGRYDWKGKIALHSSGALTSDELRVLQRKGALVASVHPLMTFVKGSHPCLKGVPFAIEGDRLAVRAARRIVRDLGGEAYAIRKRDKAAYHAWGTFASPLLTALLATTEHVAGLAGVQPKAARRKMNGILAQTLSNYVARGAAAGFSGPIVRGDVETVRKHLKVLRRAPAAREVYLALAKAAVEFLPGQNKSSLRRLLSSRD